MTRLHVTLVTMLVAAITACHPAPAGHGPAAAHASLSPRVDYHQHLVSPAFQPVVKLPARDAKALLAELDAAGIEKAIVLSVAYSFADERKKLPDPDGLTRAENDWTSAQVASSRGRLIGFCSANPLRDAALTELERCLALPGMKGIEQHFGGSGPGYPAQADSVMAVFGDAAERGDPRMRNVYFDVATIVTAEASADEMALVARRIRQVGAAHVLYGSDLGPPGGSVRAGWEIFRDGVPLTDAERRTIAGNVVRFAR